MAHLSIQIITTSAEYCSPHCGLYYSVDTVDCKCFYCGLHCWWGHAGRLQLAGPKRQAGGVSLQDPGSGFKGSGSGVRIHDQWI
ncbi:hypothetical protein POPTR_014G176075v4 [Populus trichocarpa]|uniref:Uncharacterized protein n=4 Tax=Populus trichocarpa TaxID=3694 RepID=A0ACC0S0H6_POPTR|nr:hypothetical protein POPTR_014G176075v4 [Populus trichocarpa]KAI9382786.1 hypothetical protein POPTR_014G176075v4 [Populus trichocarpa]KAI9382787.1 hypothetical protein POPTR_014G176075v4 [Populus trichocarpa]KAI9382788.1 hypothetical protein POPTR_014G176075v4 [Populus trichocarpa]